MELTYDNSPYLIAGVLDISTSGSLIIKAGCTLVFETPTSGINVNSGGQLLITGDLDNRVVLKAHEDQGTWNGIEFGAGSAPGLFGDSMNYVSGSLIQYTDIVRAGYSSSYVYTNGLNMEEGVVPYILGVDMIDCGGRSGRVININNLEAVAVIRNLKMLHSNETVTYRPRYGLYVNGKGTYAGILTLENLSFEPDFRHYALYVTYINQVSTSRSSFVDNVYFNSIDEALIQENTFSGKAYSYYVGTLNMTQNSVGDGLDINSLSSTSVPSSIKDNVVTGGLYFYSNYNVNASIMNNIIERSDNGGINAYTYRGRVSIVNNTIEECISTYNPVVELISGSTSDGISFMNNSIVDSQGSSVFRIQGSSNYVTKKDNFIENFATGNSATNTFILLADYPWTNFTRNIFDNNTAPLSVELDMSSYYDEPLIELPQNFWGTFQSDIIDLRDTVSDGFVDASQPIVDFVTVLNNPSIDR